MRQQMRHVRSRDAVRRGLAADLDLVHFPRARFGPSFGFQRKPTEQRLDLLAIVLYASPV
jgi:hypothetical protein